jgi:hypothetical protein
LADFFRIAAQPAGGGHVVRFEETIDAIFMFQPVGDDVELQRADRAENQVVAIQRTE